jgi:nucleotide-binding universal stress UspA family protein
VQNFNDVPILAPVDFSAESDQAVTTAIELAGDASHVTVLHVTPSMLVVEPAMVYDIISDDERARQIRAVLLKKYAAPRFRGINVEVRVGDAGSEIVKVAEELRAGLIVMPSHGRTGLKHLLLGSVAERVVRTAKCPVLVMRS